MLFVKLKACSKLIAASAIGFTLIVVGSFVALQKAEKTIDNLYQAEIQNQLNSLEQELKQYVNQINHDYYNLVNQSLTNILSLDRKYYTRDPLLSFYNNNIKIPSSYGSGANLKYALSELHYYKLAVISYNFNTQKLEIYAPFDKKQVLTNILLKAQDEKGIDLVELIKQRPYLNHSFNIFYAGNGTYLNLAIYDKESQTNYYILDSYLNVLDNIQLNIKNIFSDIAPMMKEILGDESVVILRRNQPIFKTNSYTLDLNLKNLNVKDLRGISFIDEKGTLITNPGSEPYHMLAIAYLKSINSYMVLTRAQSLLKPSTNIFILVEFLIVIVSLGLIGYMYSVLKISAQQVQQRQNKTEKTIEQLNELDFNQYQKLLNESSQEALISLINKTKQQNQTQEHPAESLATEQTVTEQAPQVDSNKQKNSVPETNTNNNQKRKGKKNKKNGTGNQVQEQNQAPENKQPKIENKAIKEQANVPAVIGSAQSRLVQDLLDKKQLTPEEITKLSLELLENKQLDEQEYHELTQKILLDKLLNKDQISEKSFEGNFIKATLKLSNAINNTYLKSIDELKQELKSRIQLYRREGQCMAARQMLLSSLPSEDAMPSSNFVDFAAFTVPARDLTGNFYTLKRLDKDNLAFVIGDCDSQGVKAAYTVAVVSTLVEEALNMNILPNEVLQYINDRLCTMPNVSQIKMFLGIINEKTGNVIASNAGHPVPIVIDNNGPHFVSDFNDLRIGASLNMQFSNIKWSLANDDMVVLYSNGILNVQNQESEIFGMNRLIEHCNYAINMRADELVVNILNDLKVHKGRKAFKQDVSLICLKQLLIRF